jgi:hypothetical protein
MTLIIILIVCYFLTLYFKPFLDVGKKDIIVWYNWKNKRHFKQFKYGR